MFDEEIARKMGICIDDLKIINEIFDNNNWNKSEIIFRYNIDLNRWEVYSCTNFGTFRLRMTTNKWWND